MTVTFCDNCREMFSRRACLAQEKTYSSPQKEFHIIAKMFCEFCIPAGDGGGSESLFLHRSGLSVDLAGICSQQLHFLQQNQRER